MVVSTGSDLTKGIGVRTACPCSGRCQITVNKLGFRKWQEVLKNLTSSYYDSCKTIIKVSNYVFETILRNISSHYSYVLHFKCRYRIVNVRRCDRWI